MRGRASGIAGDWHGLPPLVRALAPHRVDWCMGKGLCMGLPLIFGRDPTPGLD